LTQYEIDLFHKNWTKLVRFFKDAKYLGRRIFLKRSHFTAEQITFALRQGESGTSVREVCRKMGITEQTFYHWKKKYLDMGITEIRRLKILMSHSRYPNSCQEQFIKCY
jgi:putative transposase